MMQKLNSLYDIDPVSYSSRPEHYSIFNIFIEVIPCISSVVAFLIMQMVKLG